MRDDTDSRKALMKSVECISEGVGFVLMKTLAYEITGD